MPRPTLQWVAMFVVLALPEVTHGATVTTNTRPEIAQMAGLWEADSVQISSLANAKSVADFRAGNAAALNALVGQVMKLSKGKANPKLVSEILTRKLRVP